MDQSKKPTRAIDHTVNLLTRRRDLLPWWVIGFTWMFLLFFAVLPVGLVMAFMRRDFQLSLLGLSATNPLSIMGLVVTALFCLKGVTAFGLWTEKVWAVNLAKIDAVISIAICCLVMILTIVMPGAYIFSIRFELIALIPYLLKMREITYDWQYFDQLESEQPDTETPSPEIN